MATWRFVPCIVEMLYKGLLLKRVLKIQRRSDCVIRIPRGTQDILPEDSSKWRYIENQLDKLMKLYNYKEMHADI